MKNTIVSFLKLFVFVLLIFLGFFFLFGVAWFALSLPVATWTWWLLVILSGFSAFGYINSIMEVSYGE